MISRLSIRRTFVSFLMIAVSPLLGESSAIGQQDPPELTLTGVAWSRPWEIVSPPVYHDGALYLCTTAEDPTKTTLRRVDPRGTLVWSQDLVSRCVGEPVFTESALYVRVGTGDVVAVAVGDGALRWVGRTGLQIGQPAFVHNVPVLDLVEAPDLITVDGVIYGASADRIFAMSADDGAVSWNRNSWLAHHGQLVGSDANLSIVHWGVRSPFRSTVGSGTWGDGSIAGFDRATGDEAPSPSAEPIVNAVGAGEIPIHLSSRLVEVGDDSYALVQLYQPPPPPDIYYITEADGRRRAINREPVEPIPNRVALVGLTDRGAPDVIWVGNGTGVAGDQGYLVQQQLWAFSEALLFSSVATHGSGGDLAVTLHAIRPEQPSGPDGQDVREVWSRADSYVVATSDNLAVVFDDGGERPPPERLRFDFGYDYDGSEEPGGGQTLGQLMVVTVDGETRGGLRVPFHPLQLPFQPQIGGGHLFVVAPDMTLMVIE